LAMITFNIILGVGTRKLCWLFDKPLVRLLGALIAGRCPKFCWGRSADGPAWRRDGADPAADTVRWSWPTPTTTRAVSPQEVVEVFRLNKGAAANLDERQFAFLEQRVERGRADAAELLPGLGDRQEVPRVFLVAPPAQIEILLRASGPFNHSHRR